MFEKERDVKSLDQENKKALNTIWSDLQAGYSYGYDFKNVRFPFFHASIYIGRGSRLEKLIFWQHYGSSANGANKAELLWVITVIFKCSPVEFFERYIRNDKSTIK